MEGRKEEERRKKGGRKEEERRKKGGRKEEERRNKKEGPGPVMVSDTLCPAVHITRT